MKSIPTSDIDIQDYILNTADTGCSVIIHRASKKNKGKSLSHIKRLPVPIHGCLFFYVLLYKSIINHNPPNCKLQFGGLFRIKMKDVIELLW